MQITYSELRGNVAAYGGAAFARAEAAPIEPSNCPVATNAPLLQPVHFNATRLVGNVCGTPGSGAGAAAFVEQPLVLNITCASPERARAGRGNATAPSSVRGEEHSCAQAFCHQCVHISACADWTGNVAAAAAASTDLGAESTFSVLGLQSMPAAALPSLQHQDRAQFSPQRRTSAAQSVLPGSSASRRLTSTVPSDLASGPQALRPAVSVVDAYAAGANLTIAVEVRPRHPRRCRIASCSSRVTPRM